MVDRSGGAPPGWQTTLDAFQRRHRPVALAVGVLRKFGDDRAGRQAALIAYFGFFSLFPLLLAVTTIVGFVLGDADAAKLEDSILAELPVFGSQIETGSLQGSVPALVIGLVVAILAGLRCMLAAQEAMNAVWDVPRFAEPGFVAKRLRSLGVLAAMGGVFLASTAASQAIPLLPSVPGVARAGALVLSFLVNLALFMAAFQLLTVGHHRWRDLVPGAVFGAVGYGVLQEVGRWYVERTITGASDTYGTFAVVIGLLSWLYLVAQLFVLSAEVNVVVARQLWPRSLFHGELTEADERALVAAAEQRQRYVHQHIEVTFDDGRGPDGPA